MVRSFHFMTVMKKTIVQDFLRLLDQPNRT